MSAVNPYYTQDGRYITDTNQIDQFNQQHANDPQTPYQAPTVGQGTYDDLRMKIKAGLISPQDAFGQVQKMFPAPGSSPSAPVLNSSADLDRWRAAIGAAKSTLYQPLQVDSDYKFQRPGALTSEGDISLQGQKINKSVVGGMGANYETNFPTNSSQKLQNIPGMPTIPQLG